MPCYHPIPANKEFDPRTGRMSIKLHPKTGEPQLWLPCTKCLGCREMQQQQLAIRVAHESRYYDSKHFLTLTYAEDKVPDGLQKHDMQRFWKRLRKRTPDKIKHLTCGEYGDRTQRPHYHAAVLGLRLDDLKNWDSENKVSATLNNVWGNGIVTVSELTFERMNYVAGYVLKKAGYRRQVYCDEDGVELQGPYRDMSRGLGKTWLKDYAEDLRLGYLQHDGAKYSIPRYYREKIKTENERLNRIIEDQQMERYKEMTTKDLDCLHTGEKIRQKQIRERKRDRV